MSSSVSCCSERHAAARGNDDLSAVHETRFAHPFLNFGIPAMRSFIDEMIENQHINNSNVREVTLFVCLEKLHANKINKRKSNQKPNPFLEATLKNKLHG